jgi:hypothetical protein
MRLKPNWFDSFYPLAKANGNIQFVIKIKKQENIALHFSGRTEVI